MPGKISDPEDEEYNDVVDTTWLNTRGGPDAEAYRIDPPRSLLTGAEVTTERKAGCWT